MKDEEQNAKRDQWLDYRLLAMGYQAINLSNLSNLWLKRSLCALCALRGSNP